MQNRNICTYCGLVKELTGDHVFPKCLFFEPAKERPVLVKSCGGCNRRSEEALLKTFFSMFDARFAEQRAKELEHRKGRGQLRALLGACSKDLKKVFLDERHTRPLVKMVLGVRRHLMGKEWIFARPDSVIIHIVMRENGKRVLYGLPLSVGGNQGILFPPAFDGLLDDCDQRFRDFRYRRDSIGNVVIRYDRTDFGNEFLMWAMVEGDDELNEDS
jgi:hypothetical protein